MLYILLTKSLPKAYDHLSNDAKKLTEFNNFMIKIPKKAKQNKKLRIEGHWQHNTDF